MESKVKEKRNVNVCMKKSVCEFGYFDVFSFCYVFFYFSNGLKHQVVGYFDDILSFDVMK